MIHTHKNLYLKRQDTSFNVSNICLILDSEFHDTKTVSIVKRLKKTEKTLKTVKHKKKLQVSHQ